MALGLLTALHAVLPQLAGTDAALMATVHHWYSPGLTAVMLALTEIGAVATFASAVGVVVVLLLYRGHSHPAAILGGALLGAFALNESLKLHFHRARPVVPWSIGYEPTFSFPSGHSLFACALYGTLAYLALRPPTSAARKTAILLPAILLPLGIGLSRIYLGMHFPTDVLAGYTAGGAWLAAVITADRIWQTRVSNF